jgi:hypothetical protein
MAKQNINKVIHDLRAASDVIKECKSEYIFPKHTKPTNIYEDKIIRAAVALSECGHVDECNRIQAEDLAAIVYYIADMIG